MVLATHGPEFRWAVPPEARKRPGFCPDVMLQLRPLHRSRLWPRKLITFHPLLA